MPAPSLDHYVRVYDSCLDAALCRKMIDSYHTLARFHRANGAGHRTGLEQSAWTELNVSRLSDRGFLGMFDRVIDDVLARYNREVGLSIPLPRSPKMADMVLKRYQPGGQEQFQLHFDSIYGFSDRYLVFLWYLNDVAEGGETTFPQLGLNVAPRAGRLLVFPPYWMYQHAGLPPVSGDKYILSTYLLF